MDATVGDGMVEERSLSPSLLDPPDVIYCTLLMSIATALLTRVQGNMSNNPQQCFCLAATVSRSAANVLSSSASSVTHWLSHVWRPAKSRLKLLWIATYR